MSELNRVTIDFETRSKVDLPSCGKYRYAEDPSTNVMCLAVKWNSDPALLFVWDHFTRILLKSEGTTKPFNYYGILGVNSGRNKRQLVDIMEKADLICAHNAGFEEVIWEEIMHKRYGLPSLDVSKLRCTAAKASYHCIPRKLETAGEVLSLPVRKDTKGGSVMLSMCKPRKALKDDKLIFPDWKDRTFWKEDAVSINTMCMYCCTDVDTQYELDMRLSDLSDDEQAVWNLDRIINNRGVRLDMPAARRITELKEDFELKLNAELFQLTGIDKATKGIKIKAWLLDHGVNMPNMQADTVEEMIPTTSGVPHRVLEIKQALGKTSVSKYAAMHKGVSLDGRYRGSLVYHGAHTGRWTGQGIQLQNLPSRGLIDDVDDFIGMVKDGDSFEDISMYYEDFMLAASSAIRGMLIPSEGCDFYCGDFTSVEGVGLAWMAKEEFVLENYRNKLDPYKVNANIVFGTPYEEVTKSERAIGKVVELAAGFAGGDGAWQNACQTFHIPYVKAEGKDMIAKWRERRPKTVKYWKEIEAACMRAVQNLGTTTGYNGIYFRVQDGFLKCRLPSGRLMHYYKPELQIVITPWGTKKKSITYMSVDSQTHQWSRLSTHGGKLTENIDQALCRDLIASAMFNTEAKGYRNLITVHDEILAEHESGDLEEYLNLMTLKPDWAQGFYLAADGWKGDKYKKD